MDYREKLLNGTAYCCFTCGGELDIAVRASGSRRPSGYLSTTHFVSRVANLRLLQTLGCDALIPELAERIQLRSQTALIHCISILHQLADPDRDLVECYKAMSCHQHAECKRNAKATQEPAVSRADMLGRLYSPPPFDYVADEHFGPYTSALAALQAAPADGQLDLLLRLRFELAALCAGGAAPRVKLTPFSRPTTTRPPRRWKAVGGAPLGSVPRRVKSPLQRTPADVEHLCERLLRVPSSLSDQVEFVDLLILALELGLCAVDEEAHGELCAVIAVLRESLEADRRCAYTYRHGRERPKVLSSSFVMTPGAVVLSVDWAVARIDKMLAEGRAFLSPELVEFVAERDPELQPISRQLTRGLAGILGTLAGHAHASVYLASLLDGSSAADRRTASATKMTAMSGCELRCEVCTRPLLLGKMDCTGGKDADTTVTASRQSRTPSALLVCFAAGLSPAAAAALRERSALFGGSGIVECQQSTWGIYDLDLPALHAFRAVASLTHCECKKIVSHKEPPVGLRTLAAPPARLTPDNVFNAMDEDGKVQALGRYWSQLLDLLAQSADQQLVTVAANAFASCLCGAYLYGVELPADLPGWRHAPALPPATEAALCSIAVVLHERFDMPTLAGGDPSGRSTRGGTGGTGMTWNQRLVVAVAHALDIQHGAVLLLPNGALRVCLQMLAELVLSHAAGSLEADKVDPFAFGNVRPLKAVKSALKKELLELLLPNVAVDTANELYTIRMPKIMLHVGVLPSLVAAVADTCDSQGQLLLTLETLRAGVNVLRAVAPGAPACRTRLSSTEYGNLRVALAYDGVASRDLAHEGVYRVTRPLPAAVQRAVDDAAAAAAVAAAGGAGAGP